MEVPEEGTFQSALSVVSEVASGNQSNLSKLLSLPELPLPILKKGVLGPLLGWLWQVHEMVVFIRCLALCTCFQCCIVVPALFLIQFLSKITARVKGQLVPSTS